MRHRRAILASLERHLHDAPSITSQLSAKGYAPTNHRLLTKETCDKVRARLPRLFRGEFDTGNYPDEWHWREGISKDNAAREICNAWKSDRTIIASVVLNEDLGRLVANVMGWDSVRIAQDDVVWKPPSAHHQNRPQKTQRIDTVGFHQDSAYISAQFEPYENNSVTVWMALDDADEENGCVEYAVGSHKWRPLLHFAGAIETQKQGEPNGNGSEISSFHSADESSYRKGIVAAASLAGCDNPLKLIETAPVKEGHAIFHHQDAWHGSGPNSSFSRHRRALVGHYIRGDVTFDESKGNRNELPAAPARFFGGFV